MQKKQTKNLIKLDNSDLLHTSINLAKGLNVKLIAEARHLGIKTIGQCLLFFPSKKGFKKIQTYVSSHHFTHKQNLKFTDNPSFTADIFRTSRITTKLCRNQATLLNFHAVPAEDKTVSKTYKQLYHDKRGFWVHIFAKDTVNKVENILNTNKFFKISGEYSQKWNSVTIDSDDDKYRGGGNTSIIPYHGTLIDTIGKYTQKTGVPEKDIQYIMMRVVPRYADRAKELVPTSVRQKHHFLPRGEAIFNCHFPHDTATYALALKSEKFEELYSYAYRLNKLHQQRSRQQGFAIKLDTNALNQFQQSLPYQLTRDQADCTRDILYDLKQPYKMARLLQGDVGSGKTVVAAFAILATIRAGYQAALMVPTSPLAAQHYATFNKLFKGLGINICLLTGKTQYHDKKIIAKGLQSGKIQLAIGTETLYQKKYHYQKLGLTVIDEQHRFGVRQRQTLANKSKGCNVLSMTATPIPRTLATALYHAMDVSQIREMPKGRKPVKTKWLQPKPSLYADIESLVKKQAQRGGQTFIITKLVKPSKQFKNQLDAGTVYNKLKPLSEHDGIKIKLLHGRMNNDEKNQLLDDFTKDRFNALVATSVVEVGVDVPNATQIIILNAEAYGLAQLHQLRGRVGRNSIQSYCYLISKPTSDQALARLKVMTHTTNGFKVAEADLKIRGGGNLFGRAQSGLPDFPIADLGDEGDVQLFQIAQQDSARIIRK